MNVIVETKNVSEVKKLMPLINMAKQFSGSFNRPFNWKNKNDTIRQDINDRDKLRKMIAEHSASKEFVIGSGASHIYISRATMCDIETKELECSCDDYETVIKQRLILITD